MDQSSICLVLHPHKFSLTPYFQAECQWSVCITNLQQGGCAPDSSGQRASSLCWWRRACRTVQRTAVPCDLMYWNVQSALCFENTHSANAVLSLTESFGFHHTSAACLRTSSAAMLFFISLCWNTPQGHIMTPLPSIKFQICTCRCWRSLVSLTWRAFFPESTVTHKLTFHIYPQTLTYRKYCQNWGRPQAIGVDILLKLLTYVELIIKEPLDLVRPGTLATTCDLICFTQCVVQISVLPHHLGRSAVKSLALDKPAWAFLEPLVPNIYDI